MEILISADHIQERVAALARQIAHDYRDRPVTIVGVQLAGLMIDYGIGVETAHAYVIKKVNLDYFEGEEG